MLNMQWTYEHTYDMRMIQPSFRDFGKPDLNRTVVPTYFQLSLRDSLSDFRTVFKRCLLLFVTKGMPDSWWQVLMLLFEFRPQRAICVPAIE